MQCETDFVSRSSEFQGKRVYVILKGLLKKSAVSSLVFEAKTPEQVLAAPCCALETDQEVNSGKKDFLSKRM